MTVTVTREMRAALDALKASGVRFYRTRWRALPCGCVLSTGWHTATREPGIGMSPCTPGHEEAFLRVKERWADPDVVEQQGDEDALDSAVRLFAEAVS